ncbi:DMT family transporter [Colwellia sp. D2M02]|uniref:DMT family transporter n=1 Tax=Colwellia sp. D2M02 TaxID=2841562 RepID=UPI001C092452|nr:DMT family transporter [Colwellia sp. D2M02]MBU2892451.1 DMT family transporter [Colwellia sp. D2M02]
MYLALWMLGALASFCILAVGARELSGELSISQSLCIRSGVGLVVLSLVYLFKHNVMNKPVIQKSVVAKKKPNAIFGSRSNFASKRKLLAGFNLQLFRNIFHYAAQYGWFFGIGLLPLAEVFALEFTVPIWTLLIAAIFLGEAITPTKIIAIFLGSLGVFIIVNPEQGVMSLASFVVLGSAICFAISHTATKSLSRDYSPISILFYMCILQLPIGLVLSYHHWVWPDYNQWLWLVIIGIGALSAHFCMTNAMQYAEITTVVTLDFLRLPLIIFVGVLLYAEPFELSLLFGGCLMLFGNLLNTGKIKTIINNKFGQLFR